MNSFAKARSSISVRYLVYSLRSFPRVSSSRQSPKILIVNRRCPSPSFSRFDRMLAVRSSRRRRTSPVYDSIIAPTPRRGPTRGEGLPLLSYLVRYTVPGEPMRPLPATARRARKRRRRSVVLHLHLPLKHD